MLAMVLSAWSTGHKIGSAFLDRILLFSVYDSWLMTPTCHIPANNCLVLVVLSGTG